MRELSVADSAAIRVTRVVCIFFMMSVHLVPGPSSESFVISGAFAPLGDFWIYYLGRASVATLSLISGFLLAGAIEKGQLSAMIKGRARTLIAPMVTWNALGILALMIVGLFGVTFTEHATSVFSTPMSLINGIFGLTGETMNMSLFFLRDLFVSSTLIAIFWTVIRRFPWGVFAVVLALTLMGKATEPLIFRPTILLFMLAGCLLREKGVALAALVQSRVAVPVLLASVVVVLACRQLGHPDVMPAGLAPMLGSLENIAKRSALVVLVLLVAYAVGRSTVQGVFDRFEPVAYLAYLSHGLLAKMIWVLMALAGARLMAPSYLVYFLLAPVLVFAIAYLASPAIQRLPAPLPVLLAGKAKRRHSKPRAAGQGTAGKTPVVMHTDRPAYPGTNPDP